MAIKQSEHEKEITEREAIAFETFIAPIVLSEQDKKHLRLCLRIAYNAGGTEALREFSQGMKK